MRTKSALNGLDQRDADILRELKRRLRAELGDRLIDLTVFGSRARGNPSPDSDLDVLVLVDALDPGLERQIRAIRYEVMWAYDFVPMISLICWDQATYRQRTRDSLLAHVVEREGRVVSG